jgi:predicted nucleic acid-binding protein
MMQRAFVDTGAWFSFFVAADPDHQGVAEALKLFRGRLLTSDYIFDELVTLVRFRVGHASAVRAGSALLSRKAVDILVLQPGDIEVAWERFIRDNDKHYSFTDCTSFTLMERIGVDTAIAVDDHFRQAGFLVLPDAGV